MSALQWMLHTHLWNESFLGWGEPCHLGATSFCRRHFPTLLSTPGCGLQLQSKEGTPGHTAQLPQHPACPSGLAHACPCAWNGFLWALLLKSALVVEVQLSVSLSCHPLHQDSAQMAV